jgi:hypothetical protein
VKIDQIIENARGAVTGAVAQWSGFGGADSPTHAACSTLIGRYTAAIAGEFQMYLGATCNFARHEDARHALADNIRCEMSDDHVSMLYRFAAQSKATPRVEDREWVEHYCQNVREVFSDINNVGLAGLTVLTILEGVSDIFIPVLEQAAVHNGCADLTYVRVHGEADVAHSRAFANALMKESSAGYQDAGHIIHHAAKNAVALLLRIFAKV